MSVSILSSSSSSFLTYSLRAALSCVLTSSLNAHQKMCRLASRDPTGCPGSTPSSLVHLGHLKVGAGARSSTNATMSTAARYYSRVRPLLPVKVEVQKRHYQREQKLERAKLRFADSTKIPIRGAALHSSGSRRFFWLFLFWIRRSRVVKTRHLRPLTLTRTFGAISTVRTLSPSWLLLGVLYHLIIFLERAEHLSMLGGFLGSAGG